MERLSVPKLALAHFSKTPLYGDPHSFPQHNLSGQHLAPLCSTSAWAQLSSPSSAHCPHPLGTTRTTTGQIPVPTSQPASTRSLYKGLSPSALPCPPRQMEPGVIPPLSTHLCTLTHANQLSDPIYCWLLTCPSYQFLWFLQREKSLSS